MKTVELTQEQLDTFKVIGEHSLKNVTWSHEEMQVAYTFYNLIYKTSKVDSGCPSCRRTVINGIKIAYEKYLDYERG